MAFELAALAYLIDSVFGEFRCKHPVVWMGEFISGFEKRFYPRPDFTRCTIGNQLDCIDLAD